MTDLHIYLIVLFYISYYSDSQEHRVRPQLIGRSVWTWTAEGHRTADGRATEGDRTSVKRNQVLVFPGSARPDAPPVPPSPPPPLIHLDKPPN